MKPIVAFAIAFVAATAASSAAKVLTTKPPAPHAASKSGTASKDSTRTDTALAASGQPTVAPADTTPRAAVAGAATAAGSVAQAGAQAGAKAGAPPSVAPSNPAADTVREASERRLAKVFTSMDAAQAAKVLDHMTDNDVQVILGYVGPRQAAAIMSALPPERVAALSKLAMDGTKP